MYIYYHQNACFMFFNCKGETFPRFFFGKNRIRVANSKRALSVVSSDISGGTFGEGRETSQYVLPLPGQGEIFLKLCTLSPIVI